MNNTHMIIYLIFSLLVLSCTSVSENKNDESNQEKNLELVQRKGTTAYFNDELAEGDFVSRYPNGEIKQKMSFSNGKPHGQSQQYYENGNIKSSLNFEYGQANGSSIFYYENGNIKSKSNFDQGTLNGSAYCYDLNGKIIGEALYSNNKILDCKGNCSCFN